MGEPTTTTRVTRDRAGTIREAAIAAAIAGATYYLFWRPHVDALLRWPASAATLTGALYFAWRAIARCGDAPCPGCGHRLTQLSTFSNRGVVCRFCGKYVEGEGGALRLTAHDEVASRPIFETLLPAHYTWPDGCCVCRAPATRRVPVEASERTDAPLGQALATRVATLGTMKLEMKRTYTVEVPHCDAHANGAVIWIDSDGITTLAIGFRSHAYFEAFCDRNGTLPLT